MNYIWTSIKKYKYIIIFLSVIFIIGFLTSIIYYNNQTDIFKTSVLNHVKDIDSLIKTTKINNILERTIITTIIYIIGFSLLSFPLTILIIFYLGLCLGTNVIILYNTFALNGLLFSIIFNTIYNLIYYLSILIFVISIINSNLKILKNLKNNNNILYLKHFKKSTLSYLIILFIIIINELIIYLIGSKILKFFLFLI